MKRAFIWPWVFEQNTYCKILNSMPFEIYVFNMHHSIHDFENYPVSVHNQFLWMLVDCWSLKRIFCSLIVTNSSAWGFHLGYFSVSWRVMNTVSMYCYMTNYMTNFVSDFLTPEWAWIRQKRDKIISIHTSRLAIYLVWNLTTWYWLEYLSIHRSKHT